MTRIRSLAAIALACACTVVTGIATAVPAGAAAPPTNDTLANATVVPSLPFTDSVDTTGATQDADDTSLQQGCPNPLGNGYPNSVWYKFTAGNDGGLLVDVSASTYSAAAVIGTGTPGALTCVAGGLGRAFTSTVAGTTYYINALDPFNGGGGTLNITFSVPPPLPTVTVSNTRGTFDKSGAATITFSYLCANADFMGGFATLRQNFGRTSTVEGSSSFGQTPICDGATHSISMVFTPSSRKFVGGPAALSGSVDVCGAIGCVNAPFPSTVNLKGK